jgi:hypothetical protein
MPYIGFGLVAIIFGLLLSLGSDSPDTLERPENARAALAGGRDDRGADWHGDPRGPDQSRRPPTPMTP